MSAGHKDQEDFFLSHDIDLADETRVMDICAYTEDLVRPPGAGVKISCLSLEQWETALTSELPNKSKEYRHLIHVLRRREEPHHVLVGPTAVRGINENRGEIFSALVSTVLRALPTTLPTPLRNGVNDLVAPVIAEHFDVRPPSHLHPDEMHVVQDLIAVLRLDYAAHDFSELEWALLLRKNPRRFFLALRKSKSEFLSLWIKKLAQDPDLKDALSSVQKEERRSKLFELLCSNNTPANGPMMQLTRQAVREYRDRQTTPTMSGAINA